MKIENKNNIIILNPDTSENISEVIKQVALASNQNIKTNIIINLLTFKKLTLNTIIQFIPIANHHKKNKKSFVLAYDALSADEFPDELAVAPTVQEAKDIIEMEEIERDLGF